MKFLKYLLFLLLIVGIGLSVYIAVQPNEFKVSRTRTIKAPAAVIYNNVIDFKNWNAWSPWIEKQPETEIKLGDTTVGVGSVYKWTDNDGKGRMTTIATNPNVSIEHEMQFEDFHPSKINWSFEPTKDNNTNVTWAMSSDKVNFFLKGMALKEGGFDNMIGPDFERGLELLDSIVVNSMKAYKITIDGLTEYGGGFYLYKTTSANGSNISNVMAQQFGDLMGYAMANNITPNGMPFTVYESMNEANSNVIMSQALPIPNKITIVDNETILSGFIPKTEVLKVTLKGNYTYLGEAWATAMKYIAENNIEQSDIKPFEIYTTDPGNHPNPANWVTEIYIPIKLSNKENTTSGNETVN